MKIGTIALAAGAAALCLLTGTTPAKAQGPMWDVVRVNLPYTVTVGDKTLQPGEYTIQEMRDAGGDSRVLLIYNNDNGTKFETSAITIPVLDPNTPDHTKVTLHHFGNEYYFDKVWVQGKDYGYEFPLPDNVKGRQMERGEPVSVAATYSAPQEQPAAAETTTTTQQTTTAQATPPPQPETAPPPATQPEQNENANREEAQSAPPPAPAPAQTPRMPATSAGWLMMLIGGGTLSSAGMLLRRKR